MTVGAGTINGKISGYHVGNIAGRGAPATGVNLIAGTGGANLWVHFNTVFDATTTDIFNGQTSAQATVENNRAL